MKVAAVIDEFTLAITKDEPNHVSIGDIVEVGTKKIVDPDTGAYLGSLPTLRLKVTDIHPLFFVAETYQIKPPEECIRNKGARDITVVNVGDPVTRMVRQ